MQISMHNWMRAEPIEDTIARLARCGYDAIEISGEPERYDTKHVRKLLQDHKLTCWGSVTLMLADRDLLAKDEAQRAASVKYVRDCITMVKELGGVEITIVPSTVGKIKPQGRPDEEWQWAVDSLKSCYAHGQREGVRLAIEPLNRFETYFLNRHDQALALAKEVGPECGVCIDVFHMNIEEQDMYQAIRLLSATWKSTRRPLQLRIAWYMSFSSMFMWNTSTQTPHSGPTSLASASA